MLYRLGRNSSRWILLLMCGMVFLDTVRKNMLMIFVFMLLHIFFVVIDPNLREFIVCFWDIFVP